MTVAVRVIPCLDVDAGRVVEGVNFVPLRAAGDPVERAAAYDAAGADELTFLDVTASSDDRGTMLDVVRRTAESGVIPLTVGGGVRSAQDVDVPLRARVRGPAESVFTPLTVGGGVRSVQDVDVLLRAGADKVGVNTAAIRRPELIGEIAERFGNQGLGLSMDVGR